MSSLLRDARVDRCIQEGEKSESFLVYFRDMNRLVPFSILYFFCVSTLLAQTKTTHKTIGDSSTIQWSTATSHDFGKIKQGVPVSFTFEFVNVSKEPLVISKGIASCACVTIAYTQEPVMPGKKGVVKIGYNAHTASQFSKIAEIKFSNHERSELRISGEVIQ